MAPPVESGWSGSARSLGGERCCRCRPRNRGQWRPLAEGQAAGPSERPDRLDRTARYLALFDDRLALVVETGGRRVTAYRAAAGCLLSPRSSASLDTDAHGTFFVEEP